MRLLDRRNIKDLGLFIRLVSIVFLDEVNMESFREVLMNIIRETDLDIARLKNRKDMFQQLYVQYFGTGPDGSITDDGEGWSVS